MLLIEALRHSEGIHPAFVGAGGKTTALFKAARELLTAHASVPGKNSVLVTTTTHFGTWQAGLADHLIRIHSESDLLRLPGELPDGIVLLAGEEENERLGGLSPGLLESVRDIAEKNGLPLLIEADGAHLKPIKAPAEYEPAIPEFAGQVIVVVGLLGLGKPLTPDWVHRPEIFTRLTGINPGETITSQAIVDLLCNREGGLKNIPATARKTVLLNQADTIEVQNQAQEIANQLIPIFHAVIIASLARGGQTVELNEENSVSVEGGIHATIEPIAGIILAAGGSSRFGQPKQLLPWKGMPLIRHVVLAAMQAGVSPLVVVVGASGEEVGSAISDLPLRIVKNDKWMEGLSNSIKLGIENLPCEVGGVVFLHADQPQVPPVLIKGLIQAHQVTLAPIIAPQVDGQRANPVLFDLYTFKDLLSLAGDVGGRELFTKFPVTWVPWDDPRMIIDIDNPDDYHRFLNLFPESEAHP